MIQYLQVVQALVTKFNSWNITKISRVENLDANKLSKHTFIAMPDPKKYDERIFVEYLLERCTVVKEHEVLLIEIVPHEESWMDPIFSYLMELSLLTRRKPRV